LRLDVFLKRVGLIKQRSRAKEICDSGSVSLDGQKCKAGSKIKVGRLLRVELKRELLEIEVIGLPSRSYKRKDGEIFYRLMEHEYKDPYS
jgi:ribosomal 50S subunit-recycling heat shock protein